MLLCALTFGGMCSWRRVRGGMSFCRYTVFQHFTFRYLFIALAKTMTPSGRASRGSGVSPRQTVKICRGGFKVVLAWKAIAYTDLLAKVILNIFINSNFKFLSFYNSVEFFNPTV